MELKDTVTARVDLESLMRLIHNGIERILRLQMIVLKSAMLIHNGIERYYVLYVNYNNGDGELIHNGIESEGQFCESFCLQLVLIHNGIESTPHTGGVWFGVHIC